MRHIDYHMHTRFSFDSEANPEEHVLKAIDMNLDEICFSDHYDFDYPQDNFEMDVDAYYSYMQKLKNKYASQIMIKIGIEIGLDLDHKEEIEQLASKYPFDFIIGSIHVIHHTEFYYGHYFDSKTKSQAHREFFENTLKCVQTFDCFNVLGHLDYIMRYGPYDDKSVCHQDYQDIIDQIFKTLIAKGKGIEINTSGYALLGDCGFPNFQQVSRYYQLGGRIITIGTDSHTSDRVGQHVDDVVQHLMQIGFNDVTTFTQRKKDN